MSNNKWQKFFVVMAEHGSDFSGIEYHFTDTNYVLYGHAPLAQQVLENAIDSPVVGVGGPLEYKHIESIFIPYIYHYRTYQNSPLTQKSLNIDPFLNELQKVGKFPITKTKNGVIVHGYQI
ncbi:hypothetical protein BIZ38_00045 [Pseudoalteromonas sp. BZK2]|nr:hypothetical protein [Pseudoalteromonas sp. BZK2]